MSVVVSSLGMVTSIGHDVVTACAALRAGLGRPAELLHFPVLEDDDDEAVPIAGFPLQGLTDGFYGIGLWVRLGHACLRDLVRYGGLPDGSDRAFWDRTGLGLATPVMDEDRFAEPEDLADHRVRADCAGRILSLLGLPLPAHQIGHVSLGHAGAALGVQGGCNLIESGRMDRLIVLAIDSCVDGATLDWLAEHDRLRSPDMPAGLFAGEAAAAFLLESEDAAARRGARVEARIVGAAVDQEPNHFFTDEVNSGAALARALQQLLPEAAGFDGDLVVDLNGEPWRAYELGSARARVADRIAEAARLVLPASSLGETGAASGAIAVCAAVRAFVRGYAGGCEALVVSSSEHGHVGAIRLAAA